MAVALTVLDALTPTALLSIGYAYVNSSIPLAVRFIYFMTRAFNENILYRLFLTSTLASVGCHLFFQPLLGLVFLHG